MIVLKVVSHFTHIGMNHLIQTERIIAVLPIKTKTGEKYMTRAKQRGQFIDASLGRKYRSVLILDEGTVVVSTISPDTLLKRFGETGLGQYELDSSEYDDDHDLIEEDDADYEEDGSENY